MYWDGICQEIIYVLWVEEVRKASYNLFDDEFLQGEEELGTPCATLFYIEIKNGFQSK